MTRGGRASGPSPEVAADVTLSARLLELSRRAQPNGIELPIVWEESYLTQPVRLIGIPQRTDARVAVRVYAPRESDVSVRVEVMTTEGEVIGAAVLHAALDATSNADRPGYAAIADPRFCIRWLTVSDKARATDDFSMRALSNRNMIKDPGCRLISRNTVAAV